MTDIKRILVPVDGSETSDRAIEEAIKIAEVYNSCLLYTSRCV